MLYSPLQIEIIGYKKYKTLNDICHNGMVVVPKGFTFDVTVPKMVWLILGGFMFSRVLRAIACHDYEYTHKKNTRRFADRQLKEILIKDGVHKIGAHIAYGVARAFGWYFWRRA